MGSRRWLRATKDLALRVPINLLDIRRIGPKVWLLSGGTNIILRGLEYLDESKESLL